MNPMLERRLPQFSVGFCSEVVEPGVMATMSVRLERPGVIESLMIPDYLVPQERFSLCVEVPTSGGGSRSLEIVGGGLTVRSLHLGDLPKGYVPVLEGHLLHLTLVNVTKEARRLVGSVWFQEFPEDFLGMSEPAPGYGGGASNEGE